MKNKTAILFILSILCHCCNKSEDQSTESYEDLNCPNNYEFEIDANDDGNADFNIFCTKAAVGLGPGDGAIYINISPSTNTTILKRSEVGLFFLESNDIIYTEQSDNDGAWLDFTEPMLIKRYYEESGWNDLWSVNSSLESYYLAYRLNTNPTEIIGWIKFEFDIVSGEFNIVDKAFTTSSSIVII
jgi:hypothetical protein